MINQLCFFYIVLKTFPRLQSIVLLNQIVTYIYDDDFDLNGIANNYLAFIWKWQDYKI